MVRLGSFGRPYAAMGTLIIFLLLRQHVGWASLIMNGEFVLYAASFLGGSLYTIRRDIFPNRNFLSFLFLGALAISAIVFAAVTVAAIAARAGTAPPILSVDPFVLLVTCPGFSDQS